MLEKWRKKRGKSIIQESSSTSMELTIVKNLCIHWLRSKKESWDILDILLLSRKEKSRWVLDEPKTRRVKRVGVCTCDRLPTTCLQKCPEETINKTELHPNDTSKLITSSQMRQAQLLTGRLSSGDVPDETFLVNIYDFWETKKNKKHLKYKHSIIDPRFVYPSFQRTHLNTVSMSIHPY